MIRTLVPSRPDTPFAYYAAQFLGGFFILAKNHNWHVIRSYLHLGLHFLVPAIISAIFFREKFVRAWVTMSATMMVDVDHLLADPVYDPTRCSIGFHPMHRYPAIAAYGILLVWPKLRLVAIGLLTHMGLDGVDCVWMLYES